jgi:hypothetical protein
MTTLTVTANGVDITTYVDMESLNGQNDLTQRIDTLRFDLLHAGLGAVDDKMDIVVSDQTGTRWFGGIIRSIERASETKDRNVGAPSCWPMLTMVPSTNSSDWRVQLGTCSLARRGS